MDGLALELLFRDSDDGFILDNDRKEGERDTNCNNLIKFI